MWWRRASRSHLPRDHAGGVEAACRPVNDVVRMEPHRGGVNAACASLRELGSRVETRVGADNSRAHHGVRYSICRRNLCRCLFGLSAQGPGGTVTACPVAHRKEKYGATSKAVAGA